MDFSFIALIASVFISRYIQLGAFKTLTDEDKVKVLSGSIVRLSQITLITTVLMVVVFYFTISQYPQMFRSISMSFFALILLQRVISYIITRKNMISNGIPAIYIRKHFWAWLVTTVGVIVFVFLMVKNLY